MSRPRFKMRKSEDPDQDPHWQDVMFSTVPYKRGSPRQVSASHDKSPPHTSSFRLT
jgi:hypothetical protein